MPKYQLKVRQDTLSNFDTSNVVLAKGEPAIITNQQDASGDTTAFFYIGDGTSQIVDGGGLKPALAAYANVAGGANNYAPIDATTLTGLTTAQDIEVKDSASASPKLQVRATDDDPSLNTVIKRNSIVCDGIVTSKGGNIPSGELDVTGATVDVNGTSEFKGNVVISNQADLSFETNCSITTTDGNISTTSGQLQSTSGNFTSSTGKLHVPGTVIQHQFFQTTELGDRECSGDANLSIVEPVTTGTNGSYGFVRVGITPFNENSKLLVECQFMGIDPSSSYMNTGLNRYDSLSGWNFTEQSNFTFNSNRIQENDHSMLTIQRRNFGTFIDVNPPSGGRGRNQGFARTMTCANSGSGGYRTRWSSMPAVTQHFSFLDTNWLASFGVGPVFYQQAIRSSVDFRLFTNQSLWQNEQRFAWQNTNPDYVCDDHCCFINGMCSISVKEIAG